MTSYKDLIVWQKAMQLAVKIYELTEQLPRTEQFGLTSQMRRAVVSIVSNIAEGSRRSSKKDYRQFILIALGSGAELETQLLLLRQLSFGERLEYTVVDGLLDEVMKMLNSLARRLV